MIVRPWVKGDTESINVQSAQAYTQGMPHTTADLTALSDIGLAWTFEDEGQVLGIAALIPQWENRATAVALLSQDAGRHFVRIHKMILRFFKTCGIRRIDASVDVGFDAGERWMQMLGFEHEGLMRAYRPDGADMNLYARIQ